MKSDRREFLEKCVCLIGALSLPSSAKSRNSNIEYIDLSDIVSFDVSLLDSEWDSKKFEVWLPISNDEDDDKLLKGLIIRLPESSGSDEIFRAFCSYCPHEVCETKFVKEPAVELNIQTVKNPLIICPCHYSIYDPLQQGAIISGPSHRGLFRFRVLVKNGKIYISQVDKAVLSLFNLT